MRKILKIFSVDQDGNIHCFYADSLHAMGKVKDVACASHVEPNPAGGWDVTLTDDPRNGGYKGAFVGNFPTRKEALEAEVDFINTNIFGGANHAG